MYLTYTYFKAIHLGKQRTFRGFNFKKPPLTETKKYAFTHNLSMIS